MSVKELYLLDKADRAAAISARELLAKGENAEHDRTCEDDLLAIQHRIKTGLPYLPPGFRL